MAGRVEGCGVRKLMITVVVGMGVLILAGTATIGLTVVHRSLAVPPAAGNAVLDEPAGTRIVQVGGSADQLTLRLEGGGPDRVVVVDARTGKVIGKAALAR